MKIKRLFTLLICAVIAISLVSFNTNIVNAETTTITFDQNGGTGGTESVTVTIDSDMTTPITLPTKAGYFFVGYFTSAEGQADKYYNADGSSAHKWDKTDGTYTLYARWAKTSLWYYYDSTNKVLHLSSYKIDTNYTEDSKYLGNYIANDINNDQTPWKDNKILITDVVIDNKIYPTSTYAWFYNCSNLTKITNISNLDTSDVVWMHYMFAECSSLESLDLSSFNTSKVTTFATMFQGCAKLKSINLTGFNTSEVIHSDYMFYECSSLKELNLSSFKTPKVENMQGMFSDCNSLKKLDIQNFNTQSVKNMSVMFSGCSSLKNLNLSSFNTSKVENMTSMFSSCSSLEKLDLHTFDTSNTKSMLGMFSYCSNLETIIVTDKFVTTAIVPGRFGTAPFYNNDKLVGGNGTKFSNSNTGIAYAKIDKPGEPGYFTEYVVPVNDEPVVKDESCEKVIGPTWHWNNEKGVCEEYTLVRTVTR